MGVTARQGRGSCGAQAALMVFGLRGAGQWACPPVKVRPAVCTLGEGAHSQRMRPGEGFLKMPALVSTPATCRCVLHYARGFLTCVL